MSRVTPGKLRTVGFLVLLVVAAVLQSRIEVPSNETAAEQRAGDVMVAQFFESRASGEMVTVSGVVDRSLSDDDEGSRHQRFIVRLASGHTLLVAHNIDLADRVPLSRGDAVTIHGEYEWNEEGGVLHWTHHDPQRRRTGGWIEYDGTRYR